MPKAKKPEPKPEKEISEENRRLAEEFEKVIDSKVGDLEKDDVFDVLPVEEARVGTEAGTYVMEIPVGKGVTKDDIAIKIADRILTLDITIREEETGTTKQIGKLLTLPENIDLTALTTTVTADGNLKIQAPFTQQTGDSPAAVALQLHNDLRRKHGVGPLVMSPELSKVAEQSAKAIAKGSGVNLEDSSLGQSTFDIGGVPEVDAVREAVKSWYAAGKDFNWTDPSSSLSTARTFCEILLSATTFIGVGVVTQGEKLIVVALYSRAGSLLTDPEQLKKNVRPPIG